MRDISNFFNAMSARDHIAGVDVLQALFDQPAIAEAFRIRGLATVSIINATYLLDDVSERGAQLRSTPVWQKLDTFLTHKMTDLAIELCECMGNPKFAREFQDAKAADRKFEPTAAVLRDVRSFTQAILVSLRDRVTGMGVTVTDVDALIAALE